MESHRGAGGQPRAPRAVAVEPWPVSWASTGPIGGQGSLRRADVGAEPPPGPSCPSVSIVSLLVVSTPGGLLPGLRRDCPGPRGRSSSLRGPARPLCPPRGPGVAPTPSAHRCHREEAGSDCPRGQARPQPRVLVMSAPWAGKARAPAGRGRSGGQHWRWPLTWGPEEVRAGHGEGTTGGGARCEKSQCCRSRRGRGCRGLRQVRPSWEGAWCWTLGPAEGSAALPTSGVTSAPRRAALGLSFPICQMGW